MSRCLFSLGLISCVRGRTSEILLPTTLDKRRRHGLGVAHDFVTSHPNPQGLAPPPTRPAPLTACLPHHGLSGGKPAYRPAELFIRYEAGATPGGRGSEGEMSALPSKKQLIVQRLTTSTARGLRTGA